MLVPTLIASFSIVFQAHPSKTIRWVVWGMGCVALAAVSLYELVEPTSYLFEAGHIVIVPRMHELPRTPSILLLVFASVAMTVVPCVFISKRATRSPTRSARSSSRPGSSAASART
jgi:hypothetical protein